MKSRRLLFRILLIVVLVAIAGVMMIIGRGHTVCQCIDAGFLGAVPVGIKASVLSGRLYQRVHQFTGTPSAYRVFCPRGALPCP